MGAEYPAPKLVTLMAVVRVRKRAGRTKITLQPAGDPWVVPAESQLCGQVSFPLNASDDGLVFPIRMWLTHIDDPREPPPIDADDAAKEVMRAREQRARTAEST